MTELIIRKFMIRLSVLLAAFIALSGCSGGIDSENGDGLSGSFKIIGSNTVQLASVIWAEDFMNQHSGVSISVSGPGSGVGIARLIDGTTDICQASRAIKAAEITAAEANGVNPYEITVGIDALSVVVHPSNPVSELTIAQLSAIYTGNIINWKEVGGSNSEIVVISRDTNSGRRPLETVSTTMVSTSPSPSEHSAAENAWGETVAKPVPWLSPNVISARIWPPQAGQTPTAPPSSIRISTQSAIRPPRHNPDVRAASSLPKSVRVKSTR